jgi:uroporphyrinogen-III synthase
MNFTHVFITRPRQQSEELAALLIPLGLESVVQPAFTFLALDARNGQEEVFEEMKSAGPDALLVFTSPRSVAHGLPQLPDEVLFGARIAAIGPSTAKALGDAGIRVNITPHSGYTSEALLETLSGENSGRINGQPFAFIIAAPGGRRKLFEGLHQLDFQTRMVMVYKPERAELDKTALNALQDASGTLSVWTSANAMKSLSQRLQPATWFQLCQGEWLVISGRLQRLARAYGPARIHLASGPGNAELFSAIRGLI